MIRYCWSISANFFLVIGEMFVLGVPGFPKTINIYQWCLNTSENVSSLPEFEYNSGNSPDISQSQSQEVFRKCDLGPNAFYFKQKYCHLHIFQSGMTIWTVIVSQCEIEVFNPQAWDSSLMCESWQVHKDRFNSKFEQ